MKPNDLKIILAFMRAQTLAFGRVLRDVYGIDENESVFILDDFEDFCNFPTAPCGGGMMTNSMELLIEAVDQHGQAAVARKLCYSPSAINQALKGTYGGSLENMLQRVAETYGDGTVHCPVMGEIPLRRCAEERSKAFGATSPQRAKLFLECQRCKER